jgi:hypothetical protein
LCGGDGEDGVNQRFEAGELAAHLCR